MSLTLSKDLNLPLEASTWVISYLAKRGAGKTYDAAVQAEEMLKANIPIVVIDGMGIWWGLRASADGKGTGLPVVVFGGEHADLPLIEEKIPEMTRAIVESNISCVLDLSGLSKYAARKIVGSFLTELYQINRVNRHTFIEEADLWAPQKPIGNDENLCLSAVDNFVRRGGNHNLGCTLITQRSAVLNKNILTQSDCLVILRILAPQDKAAVQSWVSEQTDKDKTALNEWYDSLKTLENGEAWVWHPEKPVIYVRTKFRARITFHATREFIRSPQAGKLALMDVSDFVSKFSSVFKTDETAIKEDQVQDKKLLVSLSEAGLKASRLEEEVKELKTRKEELLKRATEQDNTIMKLRDDVKDYQDLRAVLSRIIEVPQALVQNGETQLHLNGEVLQVQVTSTKRVVEIDASRGWAGKILQVMLTDLKTQESVSTVDLSRALAEHGWARGKDAVRLDLISVVKDGLVVKEDTNYRLPKQVSFSVKEAS